MKSKVASANWPLGGWARASLQAAARVLLRRVPVIASERNSECSLSGVAQVVHRAAAGGLLGGFQAFALIY